MANWRAPADAEEGMPLGGGMDQAKLVTTIAQKPDNFAWFLGAGASRMSGLPTATDLIWDLKVRQYCKNENQDISDIDIRSEVTRARLQDYFDSRGFPPEWAPEEYSLYFEKIFGADKGLQRRYIAAMLDEKKVNLTVGNRVLGAMMSGAMAKVVFTTNFDSVVEKSIAEVAGGSISAYHLEASANVRNAFNNEEFPLYCKLHGDFRYDSLKNLESDLAAQDTELSEVCTAAVTRYGLVVLGYSGRDQSVMSMLEAALDAPNPYPNGLFWCGIKGSKPLPAVAALLSRAVDKGVDAAFVEIDTFDTFMLKLWRNIPTKSHALNSKVQKATMQVVCLPMPAGSRNPVIRLNALPIVSLPMSCSEAVSSKQIDWTRLGEIAKGSARRHILTLQKQVLFWGQRDTLRNFAP